MSFEWWFPCIMHRLIVTIVKIHMLILDVCFLKVLKLEDLKL